MLAHLSAVCGFFFPFGYLLGPLIVWLVKREGSAFVDDQGKEALNAQISFTIYSLAAIFIGALLIGCAMIGGSSHQYGPSGFFPLGMIPIAVALVGLVFILDIVLVIKASITTNRGEAYRYPLIFRFVK